LLIRLKKHRPRCLFCRPTLGSLSGGENMCKKHGKKKHSYDDISFLITAKIRTNSHMPQITGHMRSSQQLSAVEFYTILTMILLELKKTDSIRITQKFDARSCNNFSCRKAIGITYSECESVVLVIPYTNRMHLIILYHLWPVRLYHIYPLYPMNGTIFRANILNIKCVF
jgi:hypothetical protein